MTAPRATRAQLVPLLTDLVRRADADVPGDAPGRAVVVVHADPEAVPVVGEVAGRQVDVVGTRSPLAIRRALHESRGDVLLVLTDLDPKVLGDDVLARTT